MWSTLVFVLAFPLNCVGVLEPLVQPDYKFSLTKCVLAASKMYVTRKDTITVALPITDYLNNVTSVITSNQLLLMLLTKEMKWTLLTENMNKYTASKTLSLEKISKSYIIFIRNNGEIFQNLKKLKTLNSWNPHSNFFVVSATIFENPAEVAEEVFEALWEQQLLNGVVLLANPKNTRIFDVYSSKPFANGNCGRSSGQMKLIDSCTMGVFKKKRVLFGNKVPKRLDNCTLSVGFVKVVPFVMDIKNNSMDTEESYHTEHGIEINLLNMIINFLGLNAVYYEEGNGEVFPNGTATENLLLLKEGKIDVAIGSYVKTFLRSYYFDGSLIYLQDRLMWCVPHVPILVNSRNFLEIIDVTSWVLLLLVYFLVTYLLWLATSLQEKELNLYRDYKNVGQYVFSILLGLAVRFQPRTFLLRMLFIFTVSFSFYLSIAYQSYLTSVLTGSKYKEKYQTTKDIYENNLKTYFIPNTAIYFEEKESEIVLDKMIECKKFQHCMDLVAFRRDSAFCVSKMYVDYIYNSYVTKSSDPLLHCFGNIVSLSVNMLMRKGFPLFSKINQLIGRTVSAGFVAKWKRDILRSRAGTFVANIEIGEGDEHFLRFGNLVPVFLALLAGNCVAFVVFIIELKYCKLN